MGFTSGLLVVAGTIFVIGRKELPMLARKLGYACGRSLAFARSAKTAVREASKDPEIVSMTKQVEDGIADMRRIRAEVQSLSARQAVPYLLADKPVESIVSQRPVVDDQPLPRMPPVGGRLHAPAHTDKMQVTGGADLLIEAIQQASVAESWTRSKANKD